MRKSEVQDRYFKWLSNIVCRDNRRYMSTYESLLLELYSTEFYWSLANDANRASDGLDLRAQFTDEFRFDSRIVRLYLNGPCSVLEMMVALSIRMGATIEGEDGDKADRWFWEMIFNMDLMDQMNSNFDLDYVRSKIDIMLNRSYSRDGSGGLFYVPNPDKDMRKLEIWHQMVRYLDTIYDPTIYW